MGATTLIPNEPSFFKVHSICAQRIGSPAADFGETRLRKITFSTKWPPHPHAEGGQVEPVLGAIIVYLTLLSRFNIM